MFGYVDAVLCAFLTVPQEPVGQADHLQNKKSAARQATQRKTIMRSNNDQWIYDQEIGFSADDVVIKVAFRVSLHPTFNDL